MPFSICGQQIFDIPLSRRYVINAEYPVEGPVFSGEDASYEIKKEGS
jgi:hypothetical protein